MKILILLSLTISTISFAKTFHKIEADLETEPTVTHLDAADDPSIWVHPTEPEKSLIYASDKNFGLTLFNLQGKLLKTFDIGPINNVDIKQNITLNNTTIDILGASNKKYHSLDLYKVNGENIELLARVKAPNGKKVYGLCVGLDKKNIFNAFISVKNVGIFQYHLVHKENQYSLQLVQSIINTNTIEGCIVDTYWDTVYYAEEETGIWKKSLEANAESMLIQKVDTNSLRDDLEGLALHEENNGEGFIVVSSQGNNSYAAIDRKTNQYMKSFQIKGNDRIDFVTVTDGIEISSKNLGSQFPDGVLIVQDNENTTKDGDLLKQNFKIIDLKKVINFVKQK